MSDQPKRTLLGKASEGATADQELGRWVEVQAPDLDAAVQLDSDYRNYMLNRTDTTGPMWKDPPKFTPPQEDVSFPTNEGFKNLSPRRVGDRRAKNKAARKARRRNRKK